MKSLKIILDRENAFMIVNTMSTDIFSEAAFKKLSAAHTKDTVSNSPDKQKTDDNKDVVISHILGLPNDIFPHSK